jgi:hypothetical protein
LQYFLDVGAGSARGIIGAKNVGKSRKTKEKARCGGMNAAGLVEPTVVEIYVDILPFYGYFMFLW